jgi:hypothetical protein
VSALAAALLIAWAFRQQIREAACRAIHAGRYLRLSHVGHGALRCARCGAGFAGPFDAVGLDNASVSDATLAKYVPADEREDEAPKPKPVPKPLAPVAQFKRAKA